jgi:mRNA interferase RelE/StbE
MATVTLTDAALEDLRRAGPVRAALLLGRLRLLEREPEVGTPLLDPATGYRSLDALDGAGRVVYDSDATGVTVRVVWVDGARTDGDAYDEALRRMRAADPPDLVALANIVRRIARATGVRLVPRDRLRQPVPDWLAESLESDAGLSALEVAAMDALTAFAAWNRFLVVSTQHDANNRQ